MPSPAKKGLAVIIDWMRRLGRHEPAVLMVVLIIAGSLWGFVKLSDEVIEGETHAVDRKLIIAMRNPGDLSDPLGPKWLEEMGRDFTALGGVGVLSFLTLASAGFLFLQHKNRSAVFLIAAVGLGLALSFLLKSGFDRPRPELVPHESYVYTASFPSGHAMMSAVTYLTLGILLARHQPRRRLKAYLILLALVITLAVGLSRVYLGVHWPTDVLAGWSLGASWALVCWLLARWLERRGKVEQEAGESK
ncbi:MAG: phosphatase PAP2 family protein [Desulfobacterales bacterium]